MGANKKKLKKYSRNNEIKNKKKLANKKKDKKDVNFPNLVSDMSKSNYQDVNIPKNKQNLDCICKYDQNLELPLNQINKEDFCITDKPYKPIVFKVKKTSEEKHRYVFPSLPITTSLMPRCTTAIEENHFGHFQTKRFKEYRQLKNISLSHNLNKYKYVVDPIIYLNDDIFRSECDERYHNLISYIRDSKEE
jgi:hypothetical protein